MGWFTRARRRGRRTRATGPGERTRGGGDKCERWFLRLGVEGKKA
jgi:hypothetical protein